MRHLAIGELQARSFRNLTRLDATFGPRFNVISGENGQGKTNILEAIYVVMTSKSFRSSKIAELVEVGAELASVRATMREEADTRMQSVGLRPGARMVRIDEKRPPSLAEYAVRSPVVVFHPGEMALSMGPSAERRRLLDRTALYLGATSLDDHERYHRVMKERQRALETRGPGAADLAEWEALAVEHGLAVTANRARAAELLGQNARVSFAQIGAPLLELGVAYAPSAPRSAAEYAAALRARRASDLRRGSGGIGPHRDDLALSLDGRPARGIASQGQHRAITLSLKSAELDVVAAARGVRPVLLLDDVSSELDRERTASLFSFLRDQAGQVFLSTTRPELIDTGASAERVDFVVAKGELCAATSAKGG